MMNIENASAVPYGVMILAAGQGKRMHSPLPKVLHEVGGQPLLFHTLDAVRVAAERLGRQIPIGIVVGVGREKVEEAVRANPRFSAMDITFIVQSEQRGTGHAARCAMDADWGNARVKEETPVLVLPGDLPLLQPELITEMLKPLVKDGRIATPASVLRLLTCELPDPTGYGRVVRENGEGGEGKVLRIVEEKDANPSEKSIREVAASIYMFESPFLQNALRSLSNNNAQCEYYLTDVVEQAIQQEKKIEVLKWAVPEDLRGINDQWELALCQRLMNERVIRGLARQGCRFIDPWNTVIDVTVTIEPEAVIHPGAILRGNTKIGRGAVIGPRVVLKNVQVGAGATIKTGTVGDDSVIGECATVGPYAHLRPESVIGPKAKIGNFVETKKSRIGACTSVAHLSYVGDAEVGERVNIGCGFVTCNFDGRIIDGQRKHRTIIEDDVFLGSDCQAVAPVRIGKGAYIASGSTITENVESEALAIARSRQVNKPGYARKFRKRPEGT